MALSKKSKLEFNQILKGSVLCWLATVDASGQPSVSPKEIWTMAEDDHLIIANIASPDSIKNIKENNKIGVSFIDVFVQKGYKLKGDASIIKEGSSNYSNLFAPLFKLAGPDYPFLSIISMKIRSIQPIIAPSYFLNPDESTENKIINAMKTYKVRPI